MSILAGTDVPHETHVCRDCGAEITLPYARVDRNLEGYWERAYWKVVPKLQEALTLAVAHDRQPYPTAWAYEQACRVRDAALAELAKRDAAERMGRA